MSPAAEVALAGLLILSAAVWVGGLVTIVVVARVASRTLPPAPRVAFFRGLGRAYAVVGGLALAVAAATGAALLYGRRWDGSLTATTVLGAGLVTATAIGVIQARRMTRLRRSAAERPDDAALAGRVRSGARGASVLRALIAVLTLALLAIGVLLTG